MPKKVLKSNKIVVPQVKDLLESLGKENLDQFQNRTLDYATKFSKINLKSTKKLVSELKKLDFISEDEAVQLINCMPFSIEELRVFLGSGRKIIETTNLETILSLLKKYRKI
jgi:DNA-directed RNA polymerase subunit F